MVEVLTEHLIPDILMQAHYDESASFKSARSLAPNWPIYVKLQAANELIFVTVRKRSKSGWLDMLGYMAVVLRADMHACETIVAVDDVHFLLPEYRNLGLGKRMIAFAECAAAERGAKLFSMRCKAAANHGYIFEDLGYTLTDFVYVKELTDANQ